MTLRRIWHLSSNRWNSAITEYALSAARALDLVGHKNTFTPLADSPAEGRAKAHLNVKSVTKFTLTELKTLLAMAADIKPDVIITYGGPETLLSKILKRTTGAKVLRFRGQEIGVGGFVFARRHQFAQGHVDCIITPSQSLADEIASKGDGDDVVPIVLGLDTTVFQRRIQSINARPEVVILGRLDPVKGHEVALQMFKHVLSDWPSGRPRPRLHIVGQPANLSVAHIQAFATQAGLKVGDDVVITATRVADVPALLSAASLGLVPSLGSEIICRVAEEFLLCGTPVGVSGVGSLEEVLYPSAGFSYQGLSQDAAAKAVADAVKGSIEEGEPAKLQRAAAARERFSLEAMGMALAELV